MLDKSMSMKYRYKSSHVHLSWLLVIFDYMQVPVPMFIVPWLHVTACSMLLRGNTMQEWFMTFRWPNTDVNRWTKDDALQQKAQPEVNGINFLEWQLGPWTLVLGFFLSPNVEACHQSASTDGVNYRLLAFDKAVSVLVSGQAWLPWVITRFVQAV